MQTVRVFVSSPADVEHERLRTGRVVERLNGQYAGIVRLIPIRWEQKFYEARASFQEQIPEASSCDLVIGILWSRLGSELPPEMPPMPSGEPYPSGTAYEVLTAIEKSKEIGRPSVYLFRKTADAPVAIGDTEKRRLFNEQLDRLKAFWERWIKTPQGQFKAGYQEFGNPDQFEAQLEALLRSWLDERVLKGRAVVWPIATKGSPFRGLAAFGAKHAPVFFGRGPDITRAVDALKDTAGHPFLLLIGSSGSGKSSLARAGLSLRLTTPGVVGAVDRWRVALMRPGERKGEPVLALAQHLFDGPKDIPADEEGRPEALPELGKSSHKTPQRLADALSAGDAASVVWALDTIAEKTSASEGYDRPVRADLLLIVDQLDELFAADVSEAGREAFAKALAALVATGRVWVVATLRTDLYERLQQTPALLVLKQNGAAYDLAPPGAAELAEIVRKPAEAAGLAYQRDQKTGRGLDEQLLEDAGRPDMLPLVQFALQELFDRREVKGEETLLTFAAYSEIGGLDGAVDRRAEAALAGLGEAEHARLPRLLRQLAVPAREKGGVSALTIRSVPLADAAPDEPSKRLVQALVDARILLSSGDEGASVRLAHERVLKSWGRASDIVRDNADFYRIRDDVEEQLERWRAANNSEDLLIPPGLALEEARKLIVGYGAELDPDTRAYVDASLAADEKRVRARRLRHRLTAAAAVLFAVLALGATAAGVIAWQAQQRATVETARAERNFSAAKDTVNSLIFDIVIGLRNVEGMRVETINKVLERVRTTVAQLGEVAPDDVELLRTRAAMLDEFATSYLAAGDFTAAAKSAEECVTTMRRLTQIDKDNTDWQRGLWVCLERIGNVKNEIGDYAGALVAKEENLAISRRLAESDKSNTLWQQDLSSSLNNIGVAKLAAGDNAEALAAFEEGLAIQRRLAESDKANTLWQAKISLSLINVGVAKLGLGDSVRALAAYEESLAIRRRLAEIDKGNTEGQSAVSDSLEEIGSLKLGKGDSAGAVVTYGESLVIRRHLAESDKGNGQWQQDWLKTLNKLVEAKLASGDSAGALTDYNDAIEQKPDDPDLYNNRGHLYSEIGDLDKALADFDKVISLDKDYALGHSNRAWVLATRGQHAEAVAAYSEALRIAPADADNLNSRGFSFANMQQYDKALADLDEAIRIKPDHVNALHNRGWVYWLKGDLNKGLADLDAALRLVPDDVDTLTDHGGVLKDKGNYDGAIADYDKVLAAKPDNALALQNRGLAYWLKGDLDKALADLDAALRIVPDDIDTLINHGAVLDDKGDHDGATADYDKVLATKPDDALALNGRAWAHAQKGELDKALTDANRAVTLNPTDPSTLDTRGWIYIEKGMLDLALADLDKALGIDPEFAGIYADRGRAYELKGDRDQAIADYRKALSLKSRQSYDDKGKAEALQHLTALGAVNPAGGEEAVPPQPDPQTPAKF